MFQAILKTESNWTPVILRVALGVMMFPHGAQKLLGWFGGYGFSGTMNFFTDTMGIPWIFALLAIVAEFFGSIALITGVLTRVAAFGIGTTMLVAATVVHAPNGFFMNWSGQQGGEGFEFHILAIAMAVVLTIIGGGSWSVDKKLQTA